MVLRHAASISGALAMLFVFVGESSGQPHLQRIGDQAREQLEALDSYTVSSEVGVQVQHADPVVVKFTIAFDDEGYYAVRRETPDGRLRVTIRNPRYYAVITSDDGERWSIQHLEEGNDFTDKQVQSVNTFHAQVLDPFALTSVTDLSDSALDLSEGVTGYNGVRLHFVEIELPRDAYKDHGLPGPCFSNARIRYYWSEENTRSLAKAEMLSPVANSTDVEGTALVYNQHIKVGDFQLPTKVDAGSISSFGGKISGKKTYEYNYSQFLEPVDRDLCYLSFYGLPEPGRPGIPIWLVLLVILAATATVVVYARRRRMR